MAEGQMKTLEQRLQEIETLVGRLESGEMGIDEAIDSYTAGLELVTSCQTTLDEMARRIETAKEKAGAALRAGSAVIGTAVSGGPGGEIQ